MEIRQCKYTEDFTYPDEEVHCHLYKTDFPDMHMHDYWEFFMIANGSVTHRTEKKTEKLTRGDLFLIRPFDKHCFRKPYDDGYEELNDMVTDALFRRIASTVHPDLYDMIVSLDEPLKMKVGEPERKQFLDDLHIIQTLKDKEHGAMRAIIVFMYLDVLKAVFLRSIHSEKSYPQWLNEFIAKVQLTENICLPVEELYKLTHFSHSHLTKLFKEHMGCTLKQFLTEGRMNYAAGLLQTTDLLVLDVAMKLGYSSLSHFNRAFKESFGVTPSEYRTGIREKTPAGRGTQK